MIKISSKANLITLINVFTVEPANQHRLVELLAEATESSVGQAPGFVSASLHRSIDGKKVTMYAQWGSIDDYQRCVGTHSLFHFFRRHSRSPDLNQAFTRL